MIDRISIRPNTAAPGGIRPAAMRSSERFELPSEPTFERTKRDVATAPESPRTEARQEPDAADALAYVAHRENQAPPESTGSHEATVRAGRWAQGDASGQPGDPAGSRAPTVPATAPIPVGAAPAELAAIPAATHIDGQATASAEPVDIEGEVEVAAAETGEEQNTAERPTHAARRARVGAGEGRPLEKAAAGTGDAAKANAKAEAAPGSIQVAPGTSAGPGDVALAAPWALQQPGLLASKVLTPKAEQSLLMGDPSLSVQRALTPSGTVPVAPTQSIADQVADALRGLQRDGVSETRITLDGGPLGRLEALVRLSGADLVVHLRGDDPAARAALEDSLATLVAALEEEGLVMGEVFVDVSERETAHDDAAWDEDDADSAATWRPDKPADTGLLDKALRTPRRRLFDGDRLDLLA